MIKIRQGIILTHVYGEAILVAAYEARDTCPYVTVLNEAGERIWKDLEEGKDIPSIIRHLKEMFDIPEDTNVEELVKDYIRQLEENGYLYCEEGI